jgi:hypothetical protein
LNGLWIELKLFEFVGNDTSFSHGTTKVNGQLKHGVEPKENENFIGSAKGRGKTAVNPSV